MFISCICLIQARKQIVQERNHTWSRTGLRSISDQPTQNWAPALPPETCFSFSLPCLSWWHTLPVMETKNLGVTLVSSFAVSSILQEILLPPPSNRTWPLFNTILSLVWFVPWSCPAWITAVGLQTDSLLLSSTNPHLWTVWTQRPECSF